GCAPGCRRMRGRPWKRVVAVLALRPGKRARLLVRVQLHRDGSADMQRDPARLSLVDEGEMFRRGAGDTPAVPDVPRIARGVARMPSPYQFAGQGKRQHRIARGFGSWLQDSLLSLDQ